MISILLLAIEDLSYWVIPAFSDQLLELVFSCILRVAHVDQIRIDCSEIECCDSRGFQRGKSTRLYAKRVESSIHTYMGLFYSNDSDMKNCSI